MPVNLGELVNFSSHSTKLVCAKKGDHLITRSNLIGSNLERI